MKTKIVYISGNEIFDIHDIRTAFDEVRIALNLDKDTVLFGVPVDAEDAGFATQSVADTDQQINETEPVETTEEIINSDIVEPVMNDAVSSDENVEQIESVKEQPVKKRGRPRKEEKTEEIIVDTIEETVVDTETDKETKENIEPTPEESEEETVVPILSVLSTKDEDSKETQEVITEQFDVCDDIDIIPEVTDEENVEHPETNQINDSENSEEDEADLVKLLSAMTPLEEDALEEPVVKEQNDESDSTDISVDATLEQLATEFVENQDKIASESKSNSRGKIGKLRNILPFKQSKHKDQGLGDLFGWAGIAANDEDFSVPGFFTSAASKK